MSSSVTGRFWGKKHGPVHSMGIALAAVVAIAIGLGNVAAATALAPDRAYEMVSPADTFGQGTSPRALSPDGLRVLTVSGGGYANAPSQDGTQNHYAAIRGGEAWQNHPLALPAATFRLPGFWWDAMQDLSEHLVISAARDEATPSGSAYYFIDDAGNIRQASPSFQNLTSPDDPAGFLSYVGGSADLDRFVFTARSRDRVLPSDAPEGTAANPRSIYEVYDARSGDPKARRVDVDNGGDVMGWLCGRIPGGDRSVVNVISHDGKTIFFSSRTPSVPTVCAAASRGPLKLFARLDGSSTVEISASECDRVPNAEADPPVTACAVVPGNAPAASDAQFLGASSDGSIAIFSTNRQLTDSDTDSTDDLYEYRRNPPQGHGHLTQITAAPGQSATPGNGARHLGVLRIADDGKRVYFVAQGVLTTDPGANGSTASDGANNLYAFERTAAVPEGHIRFVARLASSGDASLWGTDLTSLKRMQLADDAGRFLVFQSTAPMTTDDMDTVADVYLYDAVDHTLIRISRGKTGHGSDGNEPQAAQIRSPFANYFSRITVRSITEDGTGIVFHTDEALQSEDSNGVADLYEWRAGVGVELVSDGTDPLAQGNLDESITPDGDSIMFKSASQLTPNDTDGAQDVYVARKGGGFPFLPSPPREICEGDDCQGPAIAPPLRPNIGSVSFGGDGNLPLATGLATASVRVSRSKAVTGSAAKLKVRVPGAGRIAVTGSSVRRTGRSVSKAGAYTMEIRLSSRARKLLRKRKKLRLSAQVSYRAKGGQSASTTVKVTFKQPKAKQAKTKKGGR